MDLHVSFKVGALIEAAVAHGAFVRRFLQVRHLVDREGPTLAESLAAVVALERLLFGVDVAMISQVILTTEGFAADVTRIRALVRVRSLVDQKVVGFGELSVAVLADELFLWARSSRSGDLQGSQPITCGY